MIGPRDQPSRFAVPVDYETGAELTTNQQMRLERLSEAAGDVYEAMHNAEGSASPGDHQEHVFLSRRMQRAADLLETALMFARRAALEAQ